MPNPNEIYVKTSISSLQPSNASLHRAQVKWFSPSKGFGFISVNAEGEDIFLHISSLLEKGIRNVLPGTIIECQIGDGPKGQQVTKVVSVDESKAEASLTPNKDFIALNRPQTDLSKAIEIQGKVKWYNTFKGFGFVLPEDGGKDIFVHASVLAEAGIANLNPEQQLRMQVISSDKGREAVSISF